MYHYSTTKFYLHSKKASIITTVIDKASSLSDQPTYLTVSQNKTLTSVIKLQKNLRHSTLMYLNNLCFRTKMPIFFGRPQLEHVTPQKLFKTSAGAQKFIIFELFFQKIIRLNLTPAASYKLPIRVVPLTGRRFFSKQLKKRLYVAQH
jgi:hypothetical protein